MNSGILEDYVPAVLSVIFQEAKRNIGFNVVVFLVIVGKSLSLIYLEDFVLASFWVILGIFCLQKIFYFFLDQLILLLFFWNCLVSLRDKEYLFAALFYVLLYGWLLRLVKVSYQRFRQRLDRVIEDPYEWTEC